MVCRRCGNLLADGTTICPHCGEINEVPVVKDDSTKLKIIIIILLSILLVLLIIATVVVVNKKEDKEKEFVLSGGSRTVMIYASPTNLESEVMSFTTDLKTISGEEVDLDNVNILIYTGGTSLWHNFVKNDENAIYILKEDGFEKIETYDQKNMSEASTLTSFLDYAYKNYKTDFYDLVIYDHGNALQGAVVDDFHKNDLLSLSEFDKALDDSPFSEDNKLEMVVFRTCLMGTAEVAATFEPYANFLIASEEVTWLGNYQSVLDFVNDVTVDDTAVDFGKKYIASYGDFMKLADPFDDELSCYSIIDLNKVDELFEELDKFAKGIDIDKSYSAISKIRSRMYQFATAAGSNGIDTVDLYHLVDSIKNYSSYDVSNLLKAFDDAVVYNWSNTEDINGLSIYFPYNGSATEVKYYLNLYDSFTFGKDYNKLIDSFYKIKSTGSSNSLVAGAIAKKDLTMKKGEFSMQLTPEQINDFAGANYLVVRKMNDNYYMPVFVSDNATLTDDGLLQTNITNKIIRVKNVTDDDGKEQKDSYLQIIDRSTEDEEKYITYGVLTGSNNSAGWAVESAEITFKVKDGVPYVASAKSIASDQPQGVLLNPKDFKYYDLMTYWYKMFDDKGNYTSDWESYSTYYGYEEATDKLELEFTSLDGTGEYYCLFRIKDIYGGTTVSKLIKLDL